MGAVSQTALSNTRSKEDPPDNDNFLSQNLDCRLEENSRTILVVFNRPSYHDSARSKQPCRAAHGYGAPLAPPSGNINSHRRILSVQYTFESFIVHFNFRPYSCGGNCYDAYSRHCCKQCLFESPPYQGCWSIGGSLYVGIYMPYANLLIIKVAYINLQKMARMLICIFVAGRTYTYPPLILAIRDCSKLLQSQQALRSGRES